MALLQISEPGGAPDPHQRRIAVGIDLGTTHSLVAAVRNGVSECLADEGGRVILPSAVRYLEHGRRQIGVEALAEAARDPRNTIVSVKGDHSRIGTEKNAATIKRRRMSVTMSAIDIRP